MYNFKFSNVTNLGTKVQWCRATEEITQLLCKWMCDLVWLW
jgi:hypothetical protein